MDVKTFTEKHGKTTELVNCGIIKMETSWAAMDAAVEF